MIRRLTTAQKNFIGELAKGLPEQQFTEEQKEAITIGEAKLTGLDVSEYTDLTDNDVITYNIPIVMNVNHKKKLIEAYKCGGKQNVYNYIMQFADPNAKRSVMEMIDYAFG